jgi:hypothetical protein
MVVPLTEWLMDEWLQVERWSGERLFRGDLFLLRRDIAAPIMK